MVVSLIHDKENTMFRSASLKSLYLGIAVFVIGLALGAGKSDTDTSAANTASKFLLPIGLLVIVVSVVLEVRRRRSERRSAIQVREVPDLRG